MVSINVFFLKKQRKRASQSALVPSVGDAHCPFCMIRFPNVPDAHLNMISNSFPTASRISRTRRGLVVDQVKSAVVLAYPDIPRVGGGITSGIPHSWSLMGWTGRWSWSGSRRRFKSNSA